MEYFWAAFWSFMPISELRGGIPYALEKGIHPVVAYFICVASNSLMYPVINLFMNWVNPLLLKMKWYERLFDWLVRRTRKKLESKIEKWGFWGLMVFVMIPLPMTGAFTGSFGAWLFDVEKKRGFLSVTLGVIIAGVIVSVAYIFFKESVGFIFKSVH